MMNASKKLNGKDLITVGIFSAVYFVINFAFMLLSGLHPLLWILMPGLIALFTGVPFLLMASKVQKPGAVLLMGLITALIYFITGQFTVVILISFSSACVISELVRFVTKYKSLSGNMAAFVIFSVGMIGSPLPVWLFKESFLAQISGQGMAETYVSALDVLASPEMLAVMIAAPVVCGFIGAFAAKGLFKKHFEKAGIVR